MILFVEKVFDGFVTGAGLDQGIGVELIYAELLASADRLTVMATIDQISGTSPSIIVTSGHSNDGLNFAATSATNEINIGLTPGQPAFAIGSTQPDVSLGAYVIYAIFLNDNPGITPRARVRLIVCGRGDYPVDVRIPLAPKP